MVRNTQQQSEVAMADRSGYEKIQVVRNIRFVILLIVQGGKRCKEREDRPREGTRPTLWKMILRSAVETIFLVNSPPSQLERFL
jgi:hypothetical protein